MTQNTETAVTPTTSVLDSLVGNGKKFSDAEALARGKQEADSFIETLKQEKAEALRLVAQQDGRLKALEGKLSLLDRLNVNPNSIPDPVIVQPQTPSTPMTPGLTEEDVLKVFEKRELNARQQKNKVEVDIGLIKAFGANAADQVRARCAQLGIEVSEFNQLAVSSPKSAFALLDINPNAAPGTTVYRGTGSDPSSVSNRAEVRNSSWYEAKKAEMGPVKFMKDSKLMIQRHRDMIALGDGWDS